METTILKSLLNFGVFPCISMYLVFIIIKDFRNEIKSLKKLSEEELISSISEFNSINNSLDKIISINEQMQNYLNNYLNNLLIKLLDILDDYDKR